MHNNNTLKIGHTYAMPTGSVLWIAFIVALMLSFASSATQATAKTVVVTFDGDGCPTGVDKETVTMKHGGNDSVKWSSTPATQGFEVLFDPFKGQPIKSNPQGNTPPKVLDSSAPVGVVYKYTVYNPACPEKPLDPRIRISQ
jgi:hypothetical protein